MGGVRAPGKPWRLEDVEVFPVSFGYSYVPPQASTPITVTREVPVEVVREVRVEVESHEGVQRRLYLQSEVHRLERSLGEMRAAKDKAERSIAAKVVVTPEPKQVVVTRIVRHIPSAYYYISVGASVASAIASYFVGLHHV